MRLTAADGAARSHLATRSITAREGASDLCAAIGKADLRRRYLTALAVSLGGESEEIGRPSGASRRGRVRQRGLGRA